MNGSTKKYLPDLPITFVSRKRTLETEDASSSATRQQPKRLARGDSVITEATSNLRLSSSSSDLDNLPSSASLFKTRDIEELRVSFEPASAENVVIPDVRDFLATNVQKLQKYILPTLDATAIGNPTFDVENFSDITNDKVQTFVTKLHEVVLNGVQVIGTDETFTDTLVDNLLRITKLDCFPLMIRNHPLNKLYIDGEPMVSSNPEFVVRKKVGKKKLAMLVIGDKHLNNVTSANGYGEPQIAVEILACGSENLRSLGGERPTDQKILAMRVISTYVTFYKAVIPAKYWEALEKGLPKDQSLKIQRWPARNELTSGFNLAQPNGRRVVLIALAKIRESLLQEVERE
ncbi:6823_t:CDS:2 [Paraglomus occultum]|uniref:6823_t:CDS:1 n=1 Tax=Paraglomus occultum TaxID=144539 RepID=A0A9N9D2N8_9GLOM|nr:6823_t:CDS:2 [Paraglomus occultum]